MRILISLLVNGLIIGLAAYVLPGVAIETWEALLFATIVLGLFNTFLRPIIRLVSLPITVMTLGLFSIVINALMIVFTSWIVDGFAIENFFVAIGFSIVISIVSTIMNWFSKD